MRHSSFGRVNFPALVIFTCICVWGAAQVGPLTIQGEIKLLTVFVYLMAAMGGFRLLIEVLLYLAQMFEWLGSRQGTGKTGTAQWLESAGASSVELRKRP